MQDTIHVPVAVLSDTLRAILGSLSVQVADSLRAVLGSLSVHVADTLRVSSPAEGWSLANGLAAAALVVSGIFSFLLFRLQRAQNRMVERHEGERRDLEKQIRAQQTEAANKLIGSIAFKLARQLRTWLDEPIPHSGGRLARAVITAAQGASTPDPAHLALLWEWAGTRCGENHSKPAEDRADALVENASGASESVGRKAEEAFRLFHEALGHLNDGLVHMAEEKQDAAQRSFVSGHDVLEVCLLRLEDLIPEGLRDQLVFLKGIPSTLRTYAPTVSVGPPPPREPSHD